MTSASSLAFPGSRTLATWWRQLAPLEPTGLGVGYLFLHRLEAAADWLRPQPLDPLLLLVLEAITFMQKETAFSPNHLANRLHLDTAVVKRLVNSLIDLQLVEEKAAAGPTCAGPTWCITQAGQETLTTKNIWVRMKQRGQFPFVERLGPTGRRLAPPHYLDIHNAPATPWNIEAGTIFDVNWLHACQTQALEWKTTFGFPLDLLAFSAPGDTNAQWDNIVLDKSERLLVVFFQGPKPQEELFGFGVRPEGWQLNVAEPIFRLPALAIKLFTEPDGVAPLDAFKNAWQSWCQTRTVPPAEIQECELALSNERLRVAAPERLIQYLQAGKSDIFRGDTWLLAGEGYVRQAARVEIAPKAV
jgi:hypothetical protein